MRENLTDRLPGAGVHVPALDGLRGIAILIVLMFHCTMLGGLAEPTAPVDRWFVALTMSGWAGVDLFFVLSGFLITGILHDSRGSEGFFRNFYIRRALRIFPLYYGALFVVMFLLPLLFPSDEGLRAVSRDQLWYWGHLTNVLFMREGWAEGGLEVNHFWSLAVEEQFYLLWPFAVFLLSRRRLMLLCAACIVLSVPVRLAFRLDANAIGAYVAMPSRMDALAVGALLALLARDPRGRELLARWTRPTLLGLGAALAGIFAWRGGLHQYGFVVQSVGYTLVALFFGAVLVVAVTAPAGSAVGRVLGHSWLRRLGAYSYGIYVFHLPLLTPLRENVLSAASVPRLADSQLLGQLAFLALAAGLSISLAAFSWHFFELRFVRLKDRFTSGAPAAPAPSRAGIQVDPVPGQG